MKKEKIISPIEVLVTIVLKENSNHVESILESYGAKANCRFLATGTSAENIIGFFNFGLVEREVILSVIATQNKQNILDELNTQLKFEENIHAGLAFTIPLSSIESHSLTDLTKLLKKEKTNSDKNK